MEKEKIEKAFFIHDLRNISRKHIAKLEIVCIGSEFCQNIVPEIKQIKMLKDMGAKKISIYTSFFTDYGISKAKKSISKIAEHFHDVEIMINDLGFLKWLNKKYPFLKKGIARPLSIDLIRMSQLNLSSFMKKNRLSSIETDEDNMTLNFNEKRPFKIYFRLGLKFVAVSRFCPYKREIVSKCNMECLGLIENLGIPSSNEKLISFQNGYFIKTSKRGKFVCDRVVKDLI